jgi:hypothetical protein
MNQDEYNYIMSKTLWTKAGQQSAGIPSFPVKPTGAIEFKSAWKVLGVGDDASHFFTTSAIVYNDADGAPSPGQNPVTVGLVGLHIIHKTSLQHNWIWSTFEQVENDTKSFYNSSCPASQCPPDKPTVANPTTALELNAQGKPNYSPAQVVAVTPTSAQSLNSDFQKMLAGTPWAYYQLISTQWVGEAGTGAKPAQLGNSVQETFLPNVQLHEMPQLREPCRLSEGERRFQLHAHVWPPAVTRRVNPDVSVAADGRQSCEGKFHGLFRRILTLLNRKNAWFLPP